jgi:hypothetical protein
MEINRSTRHPEFFAFYNRAGRLLRTVSHELILGNPDLAQNLLPHGLSPHRLASYRVPEDSSLYARFLARASDGEVAWIFYPSKRDHVETVFSLHGGVYYVEKKVLKRCWSLLPGKFRQRALPREPLQQGRLLGEHFRLLVKKRDWEAVRKELISFLEAVTVAFPQTKHGVLPPHAIDAIPRNCMVDEEGHCRFFDLEYEMMGGCKLSYILYSAVKADIVFYLPKQERDARLLELYTETCRVLDLAPDFSRDRRTARQLKAFNTRTPARVLVKFILAVIPFKTWRGRLMWWDTEVSLNRVPETERNIHANSDG